MMPGAVAMTNPLTLNLPTLSTASMSALFADTRAGVILFDRDGRSLDANRQVRTQTGEAAEAWTFWALDRLPTDYARERLGVIRRAIDTGRVIKVLGMSGGVLKCSTYRPYRESSVGEDRCLTICQPIDHSDPIITQESNIDFEIVRAQVHDLGILAKLTERELELLSLIGEGHSTAEIAKRLHRSIKTVEWHRASIGAKLGVKNRVELARIALHAGLAGMSAEEIRELHAHSSKSAAAPITNSNPIPVVGADNA